MARNGTLDYARLVAAFGIVLFHSGASGRAFGYAALPFFIMLLVVLAFPAAQRSTFPDFIRSRAKRLLVPWLIWSAVYGALKLADVVVTGTPLRHEFAPWMWLVGPAIHLWFLPFAFVASLAVWLVAQHDATAIGDNAVLVIMTGLALAAMAALQSWGALPIPLSQWLFGLAPVFFGMAFAVARADRIGVVVSGAVVGAGLMLAFLVGWTHGILQMSLATLALFLCLEIRTPDTALSRWAAGVSLGVYLVHPLIGSVLQRTTNLVPGSAAFATSMILGALLIAMVLRLFGVLGTTWFRHRRTVMAVPMVEK